MRTLHNNLLLKPVLEQTIQLGGQDFYLSYQAGETKVKVDQDLHFPKPEMVEVIAMPERFENKWIIGKDGSGTLAQDVNYMALNPDFSGPEFRVGDKLLMAKSAIDLSLKNRGLLGYELHRNLEPSTRYFFERYNPLRIFLCAVDKDGLRPLGYNVLAEPITPEQSSTLEIVSKSSKDHSRIVNPGKCAWLKVGDIVVTQPYSHYLISTGKEFYYCFDGVVDVMGIVRNQ